MIEPLHDAHTSLSAPALDRMFRGRRPDTTPVSQDDARQAFESIQTRYLKGDLQSFCSGQVRYGRLNGATGYLRILGFAGYVAGNDYEEGARALDEALELAARGARGGK
jgi:hypothetical protein